MIGGRIPQGYPVGSIFFSRDSPVMKLGRKERSELEKDIRKKKGNKKDRKKIPEYISENIKESEGDKFFDNHFREDNGKKTLNCRHKKKIMHLL